MWIRDRLRCFLVSIASCLLHKVFGNAIPVGWAVFLLHLASDYCSFKSCVTILGSFVLVRMLFCDRHSHLLTFFLYSILVDCVHTERISSSGLYLWSPYRINLGFRYARRLCSAAATVEVTLFIGGFHPVCLVKYLSSKYSVYSKTIFDGNRVLTLHVPLSMDFCKAPNGLCIWPPPIETSICLSINDAAGLRADLQVLVLNFLIVEFV